MDHDHNHTHDDHDHHDNGKDTPETYTKAGWIGMGGFLFEGGIGLGSKGATGDALHALMDALTFFLSAHYAYVEKSHPGLHVDWQKRSVFMHTILLAVTVVLIGGNMWAGNRLVEFSGTLMFIAALFALGFNFGQMKTLGDSMKKGMNRHESARQHAFTDVLYSCSVLHGSILVFISALPIWYVVKIVLAVASVVVFAATFVTFKFVAFDPEGNEWKQALYWLTAAGVAAVSGKLTIRDNGELIDLYVSGFLLLSISWVFLRMVYALIMWNRGGKKFAHVH